MCASRPGRATRLHARLRGEVYFNLGPGPEEVPNLRTLMVEECRHIASSPKVEPSIVQLHGVRR